MSPDYWNTLGHRPAIMLGKAGHRVYATMRNLERGAALREFTERST
jgi:hypothetical protein